MVTLVFEHAGIADSEGYEKNAFAEVAFRPMVAYLQNLSELNQERRLPV